MSIDRIQLRKLLKIMFLPVRERRAELRKDIREEIAKLAGGTGAGGDFYVPFWSDAKSHVFGMVDLHDAVDVRIAVNGRRDNLYPQLRDGFLLWWNQRRRWTNAPFVPGPVLKGSFPFPGLAATVKIDNLLSVVDGLSQQRVVYPYFAPFPELSDEAARLGLWLLIQAFPDTNPQGFRILDVIRGRSFSLDHTPLLGDEEAKFRRRYGQLLNERAALAAEY